MSSKAETRNMAEAYGVEASRTWKGDKRRVEWVVNGANRKGGALTFKIVMDFEQFGCVAEHFRKIWVEERAQRMREIESVDRALPREAQ